MKVGFTGIVYEKLHSQYTQLRKDGWETDLGAPMGAKVEKVSVLNLGRGKEQP